MVSRENLILDPLLPFSGGAEFIWFSYDRHLLFPSHRYGIVAGDRAVDQFLLYHFDVACVVRGDLCVGREANGGNVGWVSCSWSGSPEGGLMGSMSISMSFIGP
jgi:hypothetical protein